MIEAKFEENDRWGDVVRQAIDIGLEKIGIFVEGQAKSRVRVDTGQLKGSISHKTNKDAVSIFTPVEYGIYQEFGVSGRPYTFRPYLRPALFGNVDKINNIMARELASKL